MKFDCLVTNPPYQDSSHVEKKNTLWRKWISFNEKIVKNNGITSLVIPSSWMGSGPILKENFLENGKVKYNLTYINRDECKKHFPNVGSTFSYFVMENKNYQNQTSILSKNIDGKIEVVNNLDLNQSLLEVFPRDLTDLGSSIINKTLGTHVEKLGIINNTFNHSVHRDKWRMVQNEEFCFPIQNTPSKLYWYNYPHPHQGLNKLLIPTTTYFRKQLISTYGVTQSFCYLLIENDLNPNIVLNNVNNKLFDYLNECFRYANWNSVNLLRKLPKIPLDRELTDNDIFEFFELTNDEIKHINKIITWR
ncbi:Restriction modification methylase Eco57I [uncultured Caudovirales phage]|uniref:Restriction modification methylase Eco57I n=1 Tax=uncultured Caudovirales phage TaxID=2100421 RepID=A0A6J5LA86_9CAUD|nr:Restriction modification methylase Eco57I [uncultured Caudovirales phage]